MNNIENSKQQEIIESLDGIFVIDAGAGTGKTHTITERYLNILRKKNVSVSDILLLTFTNNAAENMKERIVNKLLKRDPAINALDANISTFHSFCRQIITTGIEDVTKYLDINERLNRNFNISNNEIIEKMFFKKIYNLFKKTNKQYLNEFLIIEERYFELYSLIKKLLSKGIFPNKKSWLLDGENIIKGNLNKFLNKISKINALQGKEKKSQLLKKFINKTNQKHFYDFDSNLKELSTINDKNIIEAFQDDNTKWISFIHDLYHLYIKESVKENRISFDFLIMFSFLELYNNDETRKLFSFDYLMIDEFQDTNEMQFMLALLLIKKDNLCVVGDWKQGIYSFRNASIYNIINFNDKLDYYKSVLNRDKIRLKYDLSVNKNEFNINYRSSQKILDFSENALFAKGNATEELPIYDLKKNITSLKANFNYNDTSQIFFYQTESEENEKLYILHKIEEIVNNDSFKIKSYESTGNPVFKNINYNDIAILSRTRSFCLSFQKHAKKFGIPINYEGGVELWKTKEAILLLAVLRIFTSKTDIKGWITILDYFNYSIGDKKNILDKKEYPEDIIIFRKSLFKYKKNIILLLSKIFDFFKIDNNFSNAIINSINNIFLNNLISLEKLIVFIEESIDSNEVSTIESSSLENSVTLQTIHGAKGLEYPVVFIANCNFRQFPSTQSDKDIIILDDILGLRVTKTYNIKNDYHAVFDKWQTELLKSSQITEYDEERRLLYVAITRAKYFLFFTAHSPSHFFNQLAENYEIEPISKFELLEKNENSFQSSIIIPELNYEKRGNIYSAHDLMKNIIPQKGKGKAFGIKIHNIAESLALGNKATDNNNEIITIKKFLQSLNAKELKTEIECALPIANNLVRGIIDLLAIYDDKILIIDYKTDESKLNHNEYIKQISVYFHAVKGFYNKPVICKIFYVSLNDLTYVEPLSMVELLKITETL